MIKINTDLIFVGKTSHEYNAMASDQAGHGLGQQAVDLTKMARTRLLVARRQNVVLPPMLFPGDKVSRELPCLCSSPSSLWCCIIGQGVGGCDLLSLLEISKLLLQRDSSGFRGKGQQVGTWPGERVGWMRISVRIC